MFKKGEIVCIGKMRFYVLRSNKKESRLRHIKTLLVYKKVSNYLLKREIDINCEKYNL